ncbi:MAG: ATP-binding protein [Bacteroidia bacterium]|nr:ATP-binding protein [Bacteroidia bacterium]
MASIYGANGAGKSNLIKSLKLLQTLVRNHDFPYLVSDTTFKLGGRTKEKVSQVFAVEFFQGGIPFYYGLEILGGIVLTEELYESGLGKRADILLFERKLDSSGKSNLKFSPELEDNEELRILKKILMEEFVKEKEPILKLLSNRHNPHFEKIKQAFSWFDSALKIINPESKPMGIAQQIEKDMKFKRYAEELMCSFDLGIKSLNAARKEIHDFFGKDNEEEVAKWIKRVEESPGKLYGIRLGRGSELVLAMEDEKVWVKYLELQHKGFQGEEVPFDLIDESDGTVRLLDFVPAFNDLVTSPKVYVIDEIERSIHPLLIKELVRKFSLDPLTLGQLIFTTHESNLLDQEIFRQDEIWFVEKDQEGATDLYSLSSFKEHKTIDIRKGYLNGRYGSIPFMGNLNDLNWQEYASKESTF